MSYRCQRTSTESPNSPRKTCASCSTGLTVPGIDRVYVNERARNELGWRPRYDFPYIIDLVRAGQDPRSPLARTVGSKGYHAAAFADGPYPVVGTSSE